MFKSVAIKKPLKKIYSNSPSEIVFWFDLIKFGVSSPCGSILGILPALLLVKDDGGLIRVYLHESPLLIVREIYIPYKSRNKFLAPLPGIGNNLEFLKVKCFKVKFSTTLVACRTSCLRVTSF